MQYLISTMEDLNMDDFSFSEGESFEAESGFEGFEEPGRGEPGAEGREESGVDMTGVPDAPEGYVFDIPEAVQPFVDEGLASGFRSWAHEAGLTAEQARILADKWNQHFGSELERADQSFEQNLNTLRREYGSSFEGNITAAVALAEELEAEVPGFKRWLDATQVGNSPEFIRAFVALAKKVGRSGANQSGPQRIDGMPMFDFPSMRK